MQRHNSINTIIWSYAGLILSNDVFLVALGVALRDIRFGFSLKKQIPVAIPKNRPKSEVSH